MEEKNKYRKTGFPGFIRYRENNLTGREKNEFERELQKDPFAREAEEGLSSVAPEEISRDMDTLSARLRKRTSTGRRIMIYRIAASVAVLMTLSAVFILLNRRQVQDSGKISQNEMAVTLKSEQKEIKSIDETKAEITSPAPSAKTDRPIVVVQEKKKSAVKEQKAEEEPVITRMDTIKKADLAIAREIAPEERVAENIPGAPMSRSLVAMKDTRYIKGKVFSSEDMLPIPGASVVVKGTSAGTVTDSNGEFRLSVPANTNATLMASYIGMETKDIAVGPDTVLKINMNPSSLALNEVVVTGYGRKKSATGNNAGAGVAKAAENEDMVSGYTPPEPADGKAAFDNYIVTNLHSPETLKTGSKAVVVLSFLVRTDGSTDSIKVIRSPGTEYSDEAIRLVRNGPKWKPASDNGKPVEDEARIRIVFK